MTIKTQNVTIGCAAILALMTQAAPGALFTFRLDNLGGDGQAWQNLWDSPENWTLNSGIDDGVIGIPDGADTFIIDRTSNVTGGTRLVTEGGSLLEVAGITGTGTGNQDIVLKHRDFALGDLEVLASANPFHIRSERDRSYTISGVISGVGDLLLSRSGGFSDGVDPDELITLTGSSPNTITGTIRLHNDSGDQPSYWVADKVGAFGQAPTLTLEGNSGAIGVASLQITSNAMGGEGAIDDDATTVYIGAQGVLSIDAGLTEKIGIGNLFVDVTGSGSYTEVVAGTYNNSEAWIIGDGSVLVGEPALSPVITSISSIGGGNWELMLTGESDTGYEFRSSPVLDFDPGTLVESLTPGDPAVGTIGGDNDSVLTTDENGDGTVRMMLTGNPSDFVRAQIPPPPPPLLSEDFEAVTSPGPPTDWSVADNGAGTAWTVGTTSGATTEPDGAANGNQCAGTNIGGNHTHSAVASIITKAFTVPASGATLGFSQYIDTEVSPSGDLGSIRLLNAGDDSILIGGDVATGLEGITESWTSESIALPAVANGLSVKLEFRFESDDADAFAGFYIDDVVVTQD
jgi:hypothetical protein